MSDLMTFPTTVEEFMDKYKITDTEQIYTNGADLVPVFRMKQWFEHTDLVSVVRCKDCKYHDDIDEHGTVYCPNVIGGWVSERFFCAGGERREE